MRFQSAHAAIVATVRSVTDRVWNFSPGPGMLPPEVLEHAAAELTSWRGVGVSVMEMSHRGKDFLEIAGAAEAGLRELLGIPDGFHVLFLQGGASLQFAAVPMNLTTQEGRAAYVDTGAWAQRAISEAERYCAVDVLWSGAERSFTDLPDPGQLEAALATAAPDFLHLTSNETIGGVQWHAFPGTGEVPLVVDMSSDILSRPIDIEQFAVIYAGAQKNIGPAGLTIVIVRDDVVGRARAETPSILDFAQQAASEWMLNTPPTYAVYIAGLVFDWLKQQGGVAAIDVRNREKAALLYDAIDASSLYRNPVRAADRSAMNVPFTLADATLDAAFLAGAKAEGLVQLKGHRSVGGMRASIYNAMPLEGVATLVSFMEAFEEQHG
jgi:phosphoserine aminotransferase